ncbi:MAG: hypothetical protein E7314_05305, partial [Clostridiales bacterium]|nr:hypothetical protein [Clostridiales bacterium]
MNIRVTLTLDVEGKYIVGTKTKTYNSKREIAMTPMLESVLKNALIRSPLNKQNLLFYDAPNKTLITPGELNSYFKRICKKYNISNNVNFHMLRHPYVKHTTKIFSLRLKFFQAQPVPDALRKTRGAFLHLWKG